MLKVLFFVFLSIVLFSGCAEKKYAYEKSNELVKDNAQRYVYNHDTKIYEPIITPEEYKKMLHEQRATTDNASSTDMNQALMDFYKEWKNVKYRYGGNSKKGIDCSAFTQRVFKEKFDLKIPRTTLTQVKVGKHVKKSDLEMGDLVFFKTGVRDRHVGIYMGDGNFMHASIKGVKFTKLDKPYYKRKYWTSRRVFD